MLNHSKHHLLPKDTEGGKVNSLAVNDGSIGQVLTALENGEVRVYAQGGLGPG